MDKKLAGIENRFDDIENWTVEMKDEVRRVKHEAIK